MSLVTWKSEFYPIRASEIAPGLPSIKHSLQKWTGALPENVEKHRCKYEGHSICKKREDEEFMPFNANTCALCVNYICDHNKKLGDHEVCPIRQMLGYPCDNYNNDENNIWLDSIDTPEPMIELLEQTKVWYLNQIK